MLLLLFLFYQWWWWLPHNKRLITNHQHFFKVTTFPYPPENLVVTITNHINMGKWQLENCYGFMVESLVVQHLLFLNDNEMLKKIGLFHQTLILFINVWYFCIKQVIYITHKVPITKKNNFYLVSMYQYLLVDLWRYRRAKLSSII